MLLVTILGSTTIAVIIGINYNHILITEGGTSLFKQVILPNLQYLDTSLHMVVYGVYFKKIRQPLCRRLKCMMQSFKFNKKKEFRFSWSSLVRQTNTESMDVIRLAVLRAYVCRYLTCYM